MKEERRLKKEVRGYQQPECNFLKTTGEQGATDSATTAYLPGHDLRTRSKNI